MLCLRSFSDDDLLDEVLEETGWDKETLQYQYDSFKYGIKEGDSEPEPGVAVGKAEELVGTWRLDKELSDNVNAVEKYLYFNNDLTGSACFLFDDSVDEFTFKWSYVESTGMVSIDCENNIHDAAFFYEDGNLIWLSNVFYKTSSNPTRTARIGDRSTGISLNWSGHFLTPYPAARKQ